jgi:hypothetical protein
MTVSSYIMSSSAHHEQSSVIVEINDKTFSISQEDAILLANQLLDAAGEIIESEEECQT